MTSEQACWRCDGTRLIQRLTDLPVSPVPCPECSLAPPLRGALLVEKCNEALVEAVRAGGTKP